VLTLRFKYCLFCSLFLWVLNLKAQVPDESNQAVITIIGDDPVPTTNAHDFITTNPYPESEEPPGKHEKVQKSQNIEPTLENGFHMRFDVTLSKPVENTGATTYLPPFTNDDNSKPDKKIASLAQRKFNAKKRLRKWFHPRKKKYRPTMCGRF